MSAISAGKSAHLKKWALLIVSVIAAVIWIRNLTILFPHHVDDTSPVDELARAGEPVVTHLAITAEMFRDSDTWQDPFTATCLQKKKRTSAFKSGSSPPAKKKELPPDPPAWNMAGIVWNAKTPAAILSSLDGQRRMVVQQGDTLDGYRIEAIEESCVRLRLGKHFWELKLDGLADASRP